jgi:EAL domain-containing protein (putative c-di-GMP-specific phosphodiesterase class I)
LVQLRIISMIERMNTNAAMDKLRAHRADMLQGKWLSK